MRILYSLIELMALRSNAWACASCGKAWLDGNVVPVTPGTDPDCRHPKLQRANLA